MTDIFRKFQVTTEVTSDGKIQQQIMALFNLERDVVWKNSLDIADYQIRQALISLGWTPPRLHN